MDRSNRGALIDFGVLFVVFALARKEATTLGAVIGVDLGTTDTCVGVYKNGRVEIIENGRGDPLTPSWVAFVGDKILIGEDAKNEAAYDPEGAIFGVKRLIGRKFDDREVQIEIQRLPYSIVNNGGKPYIEVKTNDGKNRTYSPEEISAMILTEMKEMTELFLGENIKDAIITVPGTQGCQDRDPTQDRWRVLRIGS